MRTTTTKATKATKAERRSRATRAFAAHLAKWKGAKGMEYLNTIPKAVPAGRVLVHNHIRPTRQINLNGFRIWLAKPKTDYEPCPCGWAPELAKHYRVVAAWRRP